MAQTITYGLKEERVRAPCGLRLLVVSGPDDGLSAELDQGTHVVGKGDDCDVRLTDEAVSRRHLQLTYTPQFVEVRDLNSKNGTFFRGAKITKIQVGVGSLFVIGRTTLLLVEPERAQSVNDVPLDSQLDGIVGRSDAMRRLFATIRQVARSEATVLIYGESGTGKELVAQAIHGMSPRCDRAFRVVDLAAACGSLLESELFGHIKGAFTGALESRPGVLAEAQGGTVFFDEIGELDAALQPRLLRMVERREIKPVGDIHYQQIDVRILAASNRDLQQEVDRRTFRADLFHRLAVMMISVPPLRERVDDIPLLVEYFLNELGGPEHPEITYNTMQMLVDHPWPGNVRQLRNSVERAWALTARGASFDETLAGLHLREVASSAEYQAINPGENNDLGVDIDPAVPFKEAKNAIIAEWERKYLSILMKKYRGNVSLAARRSGIARVHLHRLLKKHELEEQFD